MKIVVALDKFKGSLTANEACSIVQRALLVTHPEARMILKPMADGGDGTADALRRGAKRIWLTVGGSATVEGGTGAAAALGWRHRRWRDRFLKREACVRHQHGDGRQQA